MLAFKEFSQTARIEASACDHEVADACDIKWLFAFFFKLELSFVPDVLLDWFARHGGTLLLNCAQLDTVWVSEESADEVSAEEDNAFA